MKVIIIPGNGNTDISENWFPYVKEKLEKLGLKVIAENMPDPDLARKEFWLPFMEEKIEGEEAILVGHSSGAVAALKYMEKHTVLGAILVGVCHTDLGSEHEKAGGYFDNNWQWDKIKKNSKWIIQFASTDDPYIPIDEARFVRDKLNTEYHEYNDEGHFGADTGKKEFPEIVDEIKKKLNK